MKFTDFLKGMFSIVILEKNGAYHCIRDPNGIKPLYKYSSSSIEVYASNPLLMARFFSLQLRSDLEDLLTEIGYFPFGLTPWREIEAVQPMTAAKFDPSDEITSFLFDANHQIEYTNKIIREQFNSNTDVGVLCSGGVDSSYITKVGLEENLLCRAYFVDYPSFRKQNEYNNVKKLLKEHLNLLEIIEINDDNYITYLDKAIESLAIPNLDSAIIPQYAIAERAESYNTKVLLSGIGADEIFKGYNKYNHTLRKLLEKNKFIIRFLIGKRLKSPTIDMFCSTMGDNKLSYFKTKYNNLIINQDKILIKENGNPYQHADIKNYLREILLLNYDQILMSKSIEGRAPFIDTRFYELFLNNESQKSLQQIKNLMKIILERKDGLSFEAKEGFSTPLEGFIFAKKHMKNYLNDIGIKYSLKTPFRTLLNSYIINRWILSHGLKYE
jgi:asparagine synthase (glutamine-hydrolysing)